MKDEEVKPSIKEEKPYAKFSLLGSSREFLFYPPYKFLVIREEKSLWFLSFFFAREIEEIYEGAKNIEVKEKKETSKIFAQLIISKFSALNFLIYVTIIVKF